MSDSRAQFYDRQEVRGHADRETAVFHALPGLIRHALDNAPGLAVHLVGVNPDGITSREALATLPVLRAAAIGPLQTADPPFGGLVATPIGRLARIHPLPGGRYLPEGARIDYWRFARALFAAGFRRADTVLAAFGPTRELTAAMIESGVRALGCPLVPGAGLLADRLATVAIDLGVGAFTGPVDVLAAMLLAEPRRLGGDSGLVRALVVNEAVSAPAATLIAERGITTFRVWASPEIGLIAYETPAHDGLVVDEALIVEIVRPGSGAPVPTGQVGELVVTVFNPDYPLIRYATGQLAAILPGESACGRTNLRLRGPLGEADVAATVAGLHIQPRQLHDIAKRHREIGRVRLVLRDGEPGAGVILRCEAEGRPEGLGTAIAETVRAFTGLRADIELVAPGTLPDDGRIIDDQRGRA
jgi:phenylacetate-CoA ligase